MDELAWFLLLLLSCWCLHYIRKDRSSQQEVYATLRGLWWVIGIFFQEESFCASCAPCSHRSLNNFSIICFHPCLILGIVKKYNRVVKVVQPMMVAILSKDTIVTLHQLHPLPLDHVFPLTFNYQS